MANITDSRVLTVVGGLLTVCGIGWATWMTNTMLEVRDIQNIMSERMSVALDRSRIEILERRLEAAESRQHALEIRMTKLESRQGL